MKIFVPFNAIAVASAIGLVALAWPGLNLPFDFQPDPNYSHVLNGLHLADTGQFKNTFYPSVVNFYWMALFDWLAAVPLPSSPGFNLAAVEQATYVARASQCMLTVGALIAWLWALSTMLKHAGSDPTKPRQRIAYYGALMFGAVMLVSSYAFIYQAYFLRPDNALSLTMALGIVLASSIHRGVMERQRVTPWQLIGVGLCLVALTITKSQAQILMAMTVLGLIKLLVRHRPRIDVSPLFERGAQVTIAACLTGFGVSLWRDAAALQRHHLTFIVISMLILGLTLLWAVASRAMAARVTLFVVAGGAFAALIILLLMVGQTAEAIESLDPLNSLRVQSGYRNLSLDHKAFLFHGQWLALYGAVPSLLALAGLLMRHRRFIAVMLALALAMYGVVSLRLGGYYNLILFYPFIVVAAGIALYRLLATPRYRLLTTLTLPALVAVHVAANVSLHTSHINAYQAVCAARGSLATVNYFPDTIHLANTFSRSDWHEYSQHYLTVITNFVWWPAITRQLNADPRFQQLLEGKLRTCGG